MSTREFDASLAWLATADNRRLVGHGLRGLEKECLRVGRDGRLSSAPHSRRFGSALTHPWITTDYSEALLEFVTPPQTGNEETLAFLADLHAFVVREGTDELLWPASMPCIIPSDDAVPIAQYGSSNEGRLRTIYRSGLGVRYGRAMQAIAGTHSIIRCRRISGRPSATTKAARSTRAPSSPIA
jgi:glutamate--cysteine ligase